jgi:hypothetical protein
VQGLSLKQQRKAPELRDDFYLLAIDLEGKEYNVLEIAWILYHTNSKEMHAAGVRYVKPNDVAAARDDARYCNGISVSMLNELGTEPEEVIWKDLEDMCRQFSQIVIVSADLSPESDIKRKTSHWKLPYINVPLPLWAIRTQQNAHLVTLKLKRGGVVKVLAAQCPYADLHSIRLCDHDKNRASGAHCALLDVHELIQHIEDNFLTAILYKAYLYLKQSTSCSQISVKEIRWPSDSQ